MTGTEAQRHKGTKKEEHNISLCAFAPLPLYSFLLKKP